jgi:hypothetical protein
VPQWAFRTPPADLALLGLLAADRSARVRREAIIVNLAPLLKPGLSRVVVPAAPIMNLLGPHVTGMGDLRAEIRMLRGAFPDDLEPDGSGPV